jgi:hypothetical protein
MDIGERPPVEGVENEGSDGQGKVAALAGHTWSANEEFIKALLEMGVSRNAAEKVERFLYMIKYVMQYRHKQTV